MNQQNEAHKDNMFSSFLKQSQLKDEEAQQRQDDIKDFALSLNNPHNLDANLQKQIINDETKNSGLLGTLYTFYSIATKGKEQTKQDIIIKRLQQERDKEAIKRAKSFKGLNAYQKEVVEESENLLNKFFMPDENRLSNYLKKTQIKESTQTAHKALVFLDKVYGGQNFPFPLNKSEHLKQKYQADLQRISYLLGYDKAYVDANHKVYFYKDDIAYEVNGSLFHNISTILEANMSSFTSAMVGAKLGADYGSKLGKNPIHKTLGITTGALIGSGIGASIGAGLDTAIANQYLNREQNFKEIHNQMLNEGFLSLAVGGIGSSVAKGVDSALLNKLKNELAYTYSKFQAFRAGHIVFTERATGKRHLLKKEVQEQWKNIFNLQKLTDAYTPQHSLAIKTALKNKEVKLTYNNLFKLVEYKRTAFIPHIKQTLDTPDVIYKIEKENKFIFAKSYKENTVLVSVGVDYHTYITVISNYPKGFREIKNQLRRKEAELIYSKP
ncbi:PBECR2 nuclease fold domain-containing protein [Campylobacter upsaliensis]